LVVEQKAAYLSLTGYSILQHHTLRR